MIRSAQPSDLSGIHRLLDEASLPVEGVADHLATFLVAESDGQLAGVVGLEVSSSGALLRSLAVSAQHRRRGLASSLCDQVEAEAAALGLPELFLLTETAQPFFARRGYVVASRGEAPADIASTAEFSSICPQSAVLMRRAV